MEILHLIKERRSVRAFLDKEVEEAKLAEILTAARNAPSANNRQEWKFVVVRDQELLRQLAEAANGQAFVGEAPVVIAACAAEHDRIMSCGHPAFLVDVAIAVDHMTLMARELELGTCWIGAFNQAKVRQILGIPESVEVVQLLVLGYPQNWPGPRPRKALDEIVCYDRWEG